VERILLTVEEAAERLSIGRTKVYELLATGALESVTIGRCRRIPVRALEPFVTKLRHLLIRMGCIPDACNPSWRSSHQRGPNDLHACPPTARDARVPASKLIASAMAQIFRRTTRTGDARYDVRTRIGGRVVTRTFKRKRDAEAYATSVEADRLRGVVIDPRRARVTLATYGRDPPRAWEAGSGRHRPRNGPVVERPVGGTASDNGCQGLPTFVVDHASGGRR
jgi:excisionase family DNA binding protein